MIGIRCINRARVSSASNEVEVAYFTKRGLSELNLAGLGERFLVQEVRASRNGSYWGTVEIAGDENYAANRAQSIALTERRSMRVARQVKDKRI